MEKTLSTDQVAQLFKVKPESVRQAYNVDGHYFSVRPTKLINRRLAWSESCVHAALSARNTDTK